MRIRSILYIIFIGCVVGGFFYFKNTLIGAPEIRKEQTVIKKSSLDLIPIPILSADSINKKNTLFYDMLLHKSGQEVFLEDLTLDIGSLKRFFPFDLDDLNVSVRYNSAEQKLDFSGRSDAGLSVAGDAYFDNKNGISYNFKIQKGRQTLSMNLIYNVEDDAATGEFIWDTSSAHLISLVSGFKIQNLKSEFAFGGKFLYQNSILTLSDLVVADTKLNCKVEVQDFAASKPKINIFLNNEYLNLKDESLQFFFNEPLFIQDLVMASSGFDFGITLNVKRVQFKNFELKDFALDMNNSGGDIELTSIRFGLPAGGDVFSQGKVYGVKGVLEYSGNVSGKKIKFADVQSLMFDEKVDGQAVIDFKSQVIIKPEVILLKDLEIKEGKSSLKSKIIRHSRVGVAANILSGDVVLNKDVQQIKFLNEFINNYKLYGRKLNNIVADFDFKFLGKNSKQEIGMNYFSSQEMINVTKIKIGNLGKGDLKIDLRNKDISGKFKARIQSWRLFQNLFFGFADLASFIEISDRASNGIDRDLKGDFVFDVRNMNNNDKFECKLLYHDQIAEIETCSIEIIGGKANFVGKVYEGESMRYDIDFEGSQFSLNDLFASGVINPNSIAVKRASGTFDLYGKIKSSGGSFFDSINKITSNAVLTFKDSNIVGKSRLKSELDGPDKVFDLSDGYIAFDGNTKILSGELLGKDLEISEKGDRSMKFSHDFSKVRGAHKRN